MKMKKYKNVFIIIICIIIGFVIGYFSSLIFNKTETNENIPSTSKESDISYLDNIQESKYNNSVVEGYVIELQSLNQRIQEINNEKQDIEAKILNLKHKLNNSTDFAYESKIYPEETTKTNE